VGDPLYAHGIDLAVVLITILKVVLTFVFLLIRPRLRHARLAAV